MAWRDTLRAMEAPDATFAAMPLRPPSISVGPLPRVSFGTAPRIGASSGGGLYRTAPPPPPAAAPPERMNYSLPFSTTEPGVAAVGPPRAANYRSGSNQNVLQAGLDIAEQTAADIFRPDRGAGLNIGNAMALPYQAPGGVLAALHKAFPQSGEIGVANEGWNAAMEGMKLVAGPVNAIVNAPSHFIRDESLKQRARQYARIVAGNTSPLAGLNLDPLNDLSILAGSVLAGPTSPFAGYAMDITDLPENLKSAIRADPSIVDDAGRFDKVLAQTLDDPKTGAQRQWTYRKGVEGFIGNIAPEITIFAAETLLGVSAVKAVARVGLASSSPTIVRATQLAEQTMSVGLKLNRYAVEAGLTTMAVTGIIDLGGRALGQQPMVDFALDAWSSHPISENPDVMLLTSMTVNPFAAVGGLRKGLVRLGYGADVAIGKALGGKYARLYTHSDKLEEVLGRIYSIPTASVPSYIGRYFKNRGEAYDHVVNLAAQNVVRRQPAEIRNLIARRFSDPKSRTEFVIRQYAGDIIDTIDNHVDQLKGDVQVTYHAYHRMRSAFDPDRALAIGMDYRGTKDLVWRYMEELDAVLGYPETLVPRAMEGIRSATEGMDRIPDNLIDDLNTKYKGLTNYVDMLGAPTGSVARADFEKMLSFAEDEFNRRAKINPILARTTREPAIMSDSTVKEWSDAVGTTPDVIASYRLGDNTNADPMRSYLVSRKDILGLTDDEIAALPDAEAWQRAADHIDEVTTPWLDLGHKIEATREVAKTTRRRAADAMAAGDKVEGERLLHVLATQERVLREATQPLSEPFSATLASARRVTKVPSANYRAQALRKVDAIRRMTRVQAILDHTTTLIESGNPAEVLASLRRTPDGLWVYDGPVQAVPAQLRQKLEKFLYYTEDRASRDTLDLEHRAVWRLIGKYRGSTNAMGVKFDLTKTQADTFAAVQPTLQGNSLEGLMPMGSPFTVDTFAEELGRARVELDDALEGASLKVTERDRNLNVPIEYVEHAESQAISHDYVAQTDDLALSVENLGAALDHPNDPGTYGTVADMVERNGSVHADIAAAARQARVPYDTFVSDPAYAAHIRAALPDLTRSPTPIDAATIAFAAGDKAALDPIFAEGIDINASLGTPKPPIKRVTLAEAEAIAMGKIPPARTPDPIVPGLSIEELVLRSKGINAAVKKRASQIADVADGVVWPNKRGGNVLVSPNPFTAPPAPAAAAAREAAPAAAVRAEPAAEAPLPPRPGTGASADEIAAHEAAVMARDAARHPPGTRPSEQPLADRIAFWRDSPTWMRGSDNRTRQFVKAALETEAKGWPLDPFDPHDAKFAAVIERAGKTPTWMSEAEASSLENKRAATPAWLWTRPEDTATAEVNYQRHIERMKHSYDQDAARLAKQDGRPEAAAPAATPAQQEYLRSAMEHWQRPRQGDGPQEGLAAIDFPPRGTPNAIDKLTSPTNFGYAQPMLAYVARDANGDVAGYLLLHVENGVAQHISWVETRPDLQRQGIASRLYEAAKADGHPIEDLTGRNTTAEGQLFTEGRAAGAAAPPEAPPAAPAAAAPPPQRPWRVTMIDAEGVPTGHVEADTMEEAIVRAHDLGADVFSRPSEVVPRRGDGSNLSNAQRRLDDVNQSLASRQADALASRDRLVASYEASIREVASGAVGSHPEGLALQGTQAQKITALRRGLTSARKLRKATPETVALRAERRKLETQVTRLQKASAPLQQAPRRLTRELDAELGAAHANYLSEPDAAILAKPEHAVGRQVLSILGYGVPDRNPGTLRDVLTLLREIENGNAENIGFSAVTLAKAQTLGEDLLRRAAYRARAGSFEAGATHFGGIHPSMYQDPATADAAERLYGSGAVQFDPRNPIGLLYGFTKPPKAEIVMDFEKLRRIADETGIPTMAEELFTRKFQPYQARIATARVRQAFGYIFGPNANADVIAQAKSTFLVRAARLGISGQDAQDVWNAWGDYAHSTNLPRNIQRGGKYGTVIGNQSLITSTANIPNAKLRQIAQDVVRANHGGSLEGFEHAPFDEMFREAYSGPMRFLADAAARGVPFGDVLHSIYNFATNNDWVRFRYYQFRFAVDVRFHAMNFLEAQFLYAGRSALRPGSYDKAMLGATTDWLVRHSEDHIGNTGYQFTRGRFLTAERAFVKEQGAALHDELKVLRSRDPVLMDEFLAEARSDPELSKTIAALGDTPEGYLAAMDQYYQRVLGSVDPSEPFTEGLHALLAEEPAMAEVYGQLDRVNRELWTDVKSTFLGNPNRSRLERTMNHFLLYWPLSYTVRTTKWLLRVLYDRAGGLPTNALGAYEMDKLVAIHNDHLQRDASYRDSLKNNESLLFAAQMLFPVTPNNIGFSLSPLLRDVFFNRSKGILDVGPVYTIRQFLPDAVGDLYTTLRDVPGVGDVIEPVLGAGVRASGRMPPKAPSSMSEAVSPRTY